MTGGGVLPTAVVGRSSAQLCPFVETGTNWPVNGVSVKNGEVLAMARMSGPKGRSPSSVRKRIVVQLKSSLTNAWRDSRSCSKLLTQTVLEAGRLNEHHGPVVVDDIGGKYGESFEKASRAVDSDQGNMWAREALAANLVEASSRSEESSGTDVQMTINGHGAVSMSTLVLDRKPITGGAFDFSGATAPLTIRPIQLAKKIVLVRHGLSSWNAEGRIQGSSDLSILSGEGMAQAERCKQSLAKLKFSTCFASPISRAKSSAEIIWSGREEPLIFLDSLKEANLLFLEGMRNVDAKVQHPEQYRAWREDPVNFHVDGVYPVVKLWAQARNAWQEILSAEGELILVITHKSILRALLCTALGMGPDRFRAVDINNGGISVFSVNKKGEPLLQCLNMTAHLHVDGVFY